MPDISKLAVLLSLNAGQFSTGCRSAAVDLRGLGSTVDDVAGTVGGFALKVASLGAGLLGGIGLGQGVKLAAEFEQTTVAMSTMLKSGEAAKSLLADLTSFAASTPFEFPEIASAAKLLLAYGSSAKEILPQIKMLGDVAAGVSQPLGDIAYLFGTVRTQGKAMTVDINQFAGRGIPIYAALAKTLGTTTAGVRQLAEQGQITFETINSAFVEMTKSGGQFSGMMVAQSNTVSGLFSTLKDNVGLALREIGDVLIREFNIKDGLRGAVDAVADFGKRTIVVVSAVAGWVKGNWDLLIGLGKQVAIISGTVFAMRTLVAAIGAVNTAYKAVAASQVMVLALSGPGGWAKLAAGAAIGAAAIYGLNKAWDGVAAAAKRATEESVKATEVAGQMAYRPNVPGMSEAAILGPEKLSELNAHRAALDALLRQREELNRGRRFTESDALQPQIDALASRIQIVVAGVENYVQLLARMKARADAVVAPSILSAEGAAQVKKAVLDQAAAQQEAAHTARENAAAVNKTIDGFRLEAQHAGLSAAQVELHNLALRNATHEQLQAAAAALSWRAAQEGLARQGQAIQEIVRGLYERAHATAFAGTQLELYRLKQLNATDAELANARALAKTADALENQRKLMDEMEAAGKSVAESVLTPWERLGEELKRLAKIEAAGMLNRTLALRSAKQQIADVLKTGSAGGSRLDALEMRFTAGFRQDKPDDWQTKLLAALNGGAKLTKEMRDYLKLLADRPELVARLGGA